MDFTEQRTICEYNFVFTLWKFPKLYGKFINKINKIENFFSNKDANFYYVLGLQLFKRGFKTFDELTVLTMVNSNVLLLDAYNKKGGYDIFLTASKNLVEENIDGYFNEILKLNTLSVLQDNGINIEKDYEKITKMDLDQLKMFYNYKISNVFLTTASETKIQSLDITDDDIAYFNAGSSMGLSIAQLAPLLNYEILGINKGITFIGGLVNGGKAQKLSAKVITPNGYTTIGQIKIGDKICGEDGKVYNVTGVFDRGIKKNYRVKFNDESYTECCDEHLWNVNKTTFKDKNKFVTVMLKDILNDSVGLKSKSNNAYRYSIPEYQPVYMDEKEHIIHPYLLGVLLGDGYLCGQTLSISSIETDVVDKCKSLLDDNYTIKKSSGNNYSWNLINIKEKYNKYKREIKRLDLEKKSNDKFIPDEYKYDSISNRLELLRGLFDTDGCVDTKSNNYSICTKSDRLKDDILFISRSLGMLASAKWSHRNNDKNKECWHISIRFNENLKPFSSKKHIEKYKPNKRNKSLRRKIASIEYIGEEQMKCIMVDNPTHLYLTDDFIVTHNTSFSLAIIVMSWILNNVKCCIISNEQTIIEFKQFLMAMASYRLFGEDNNSLTKRRIKIGSYNVDEIEKLTQIKNYVNEHFAPYLSFAKIFDYNINEVQMIVETMSVKGYSGFVYDVFKAEDRTNGRVVDEMIEMSKCLFKSADHTDTSIVATLQLGLTYNNIRYLNMNCISSSKQVAEVASEIILIRTMWDDEVTGAEHDIKIFNYIYDKYGQKMLDAEGNPLIKEIPVNGNEYKNIKLAFIAKTRNTGEFKVIAYHFNGDYNKWVELGYCNPHFTNRENKK